MLLDDSIKEHRLSFLLKSFFNKFSYLSNFFIKEFSIIALEEKEKVVIYKNSKNSLFIEKEVKDGFIFIIENIINKKDLRLESKYELIKIGYEIDMDLEILFKLTRWQQGIKGRDYFFCLERFYPNLKKLVLSEKLSINEAFNFFRIVSENSDIFLEKIPHSLTFSEMSRVIQYFIEIYNKEKDIDKIISRIDFSSKESFLNSIFKLRYEKYSYYLTKFTDYINQLNLPNGVKILYDSNFENENYQLIIDFTNKEKLLKKIKSMLYNLENIKKDLFSHKNLFEEEN